MTTPTTTTTTDPVEAEATGQQYIVATYRGRDYKVLLDADRWPLDLVETSVVYNQETKKLEPHRQAIASALTQILGDQWADFLHAFPLARDLVPASHAFAAAIGFTVSTGDVAFGPMPIMLARLGHYRDAIEATLATLGLDYRDRFRFDEDGLRRLTLRQIHVRLAHAPLNSPLAIAQNGGRLPHTGEELLLMDLFEAVTKVRHPSRPLSANELAERDKAQAKRVKQDDAVADYYRRHPQKSSTAERRKTAIETARANAHTGKKAAHARPQEECEADRGQGD